MPTRRSFIISVPPLVFSRYAVADTPGDVLTARVNLAAAGQETDGGQRQPAAAWIACVATVLASYGHAVPQRQILAEAYGNSDRVPQVPDAAAARQLNRMWTDASGALVRVAVEPLYDTAVARGVPDLAVLAEALRHADPLILTGSDHPVVLTGLELNRGVRSALALRSGCVFDPYPKVGFRALVARELTARQDGGELSLVLRITLPGFG